MRMLNLSQNDLAPPRRGGIAIIDLLRTTMCIGIIVVHCRELFEIGSGIDLYTQRFHYFTDVFFIMSGYLLAQRERTGSHGAFLLSRLVRIYPLHLATFLFCLVLVGVKSLGSGGAPVPVWTAVSHLTLTHGLGLAESPYAFNGPSWSISALFLCWLLLPVLSKVLHRGPWVGLAGVAGLFLLGALVSEGELSRAADLGIGAARCLPDFAFGLVLARIRPSAGQTVPLAIAGACLALAAIPGALPNDLACVIVVYVFFTAIHGLAQTGYRPPDWTGRLTRLAPYSLGVFMLHYPVLRIAGNLLPRDYTIAHAWVGAALTAGIAVVSLGLAILSHHLFEVPVAAWLTVRLRAMPVPVVGTSATAVGEPATWRATVWRTTAWRVTARRATAWRATATARMAGAR